MEIEKRDIMLITACMIAGCVFMLVVSDGSPWALLPGAASGAGGGCLAAIFRRAVTRNHKRQQTTTFRCPRNEDSFPAGAGGEPGARAAHARFWEGPGVNWTRIKYCDTTRGNGWTTGKTNRILNPRDPGLLTRSRR